MRFFCIFFVLVFFTACGNSAVTVFNNIGDDEIHIGVVYPVALRDRDTYLRQGIELAVEQINAEGGVLGRSLRTVIRDDENDAHIAMQIANTMYEQGITAVVGHWSTNICYFVADVYQENRVVMITPAATGTNLFEYKSHYIFRMGSNHDIYAEAIARHMSEEGFSRAAIFHSDDEYGNDFALNIERALSKENIIVIDRITNISPASIDSIMARWNAFDCDGVVVAALMPGIIEPIQLIRGANRDIPIFGADNFYRTNFSSYFEGYMENIFKAAFDFDSLCGNFHEKFRETYGHDPDIRAISGYAAVRLIADAMEAAGTTDSTAIADFLSQLENHPTVFGKLSYNEISHEFENFNVGIIRLGD
ncbi:MAG: ABC transporter substrate-binding protein [Defluviitaleaceae bacterium]|nr:ABC transporter substrate-binding protein [Defluviitaleaceae bacterium]